MSSGHIFSKSGSLTQTPLTLNLDLTCSRYAEAYASQRNYRVISVHIPTTSSEKGPPFATGYALRRHHRSRLGLVLIDYGRSTK